MAASWLDTEMRAALDAKRRGLEQQLEELVTLLGDSPVPLPQRTRGSGRVVAPVRAARRGLTKAERAAISARMKAVWAKRKKAGVV